MHVSVNPRKGKIHLTVPEGHVVPVHATWSGAESSVFRAVPFSGGDLKSSCTAG